VSAHGLPTFLPQRATTGQSALVVLAVSSVKPQKTPDVTSQTGSSTGNWRGLRAASGIAATPSSTAGNTAFDEGPPVNAVASIRPPSTPAATPAHTARTDPPDRFKPAAVAASRLDRRFDVLVAITMRGGRAERAETFVPDVGTSSRRRGTGETVCPLRRVLHGAD
jgi:hypothetical protein